MKRPAILPHMDLLQQESTQGVVGNPEKKISYLLLKLRDITEDKETITTGFPLLALRNFQVPTFKLIFSTLSSNFSNIQTQHHHHSQHNQIAPKNKNANLR